MKIKKLLPVYASSYYQVLKKELMKDYKTNCLKAKKDIVEKTSYEKCIQVGSKKVCYRVVIDILEENVCYQVSMHFPNYTQIITHHIKQIDDDGVIALTYCEKVVDCSLFYRCLFALKARLVRVKVMCFINYLYQKALCLEENKR
ncbi:MAG: DUF3284 domain-containing protein [Erysipelotrichia bacterium]|nr:DUF3284 domain-containing protein [Erysipelotrichia bacterium]NCC54918.1 DUF3284 domain-containing protein [Erysipelotrichia bacterium]